MKRVCRHRLQRTGGAESLYHYRRETPTISRSHQNGVKSRYQQRDASVRTAGTGPPRDAHARAPKDLPLLAAHAAVHQNYIHRHAARTRARARRRESGGSWALAVTST
jgi:hypothetical protein